MGLKATIITYILIGLVIVCFLGFVIQFQQDNNTTIRLSNDSTVITSYNQLNNNLSTITTTGNDISNTTEEEQPDIGQSLLLPSIKNSAVTLWRVPKVIFIILGTFIAKYVSAFVIGIFGAILTLILFFEFVDYLRSGN